MSDTEVTLPEDPQAYVEQVMAEIAEEVRLRHASGDLPPKLERELDELFLAHSPVAGRGGDLGTRCGWSTPPPSSIRWCPSTRSGRPEPSSRKGCGRSSSGTSGGSRTR